MNKKIFSRIFYTQLLFHFFPIACVLPPRITLSPPTESDLDRTLKTTIPFIIQHSPEGSRINRKYEYYKTIKEEEAFVREPTFRELTEMATKKAIEEYENKETVEIPPNEYQRLLSKFTHQPVWRIGKQPFEIENTTNQTVELSITTPGKIEEKRIAPNKTLSLKLLSLSIKIPSISPYSESIGNKFNVGPMDKRMILEDNLNIRSDVEIIPMDSEPPFDYGKLEFDYEEESED